MVTIATTLTHKKATLRSVFAGDTQWEIFSTSQTTLYFAYFYFPSIPQVHFGFANEKITILIIR